MVNNASKKQHAYRESIESKARAHIVQYLTTPPDGLPWWESLKSYICDASREYYQRLLVELIQNGCDALSRGETDGEIWILLDRSEGEHGVLYVANQGQPFDKENFLSINEPGHSNKKPGEGIGHKGVGFRSVLQVCEWPEIYSADPANQSPHCFTGYCFGYARPDDIIQLTDGNLKKAEQVRRNLIHHFLPIPLRGQNATVRKFAGLGMATVIRLPIKTARAAESTEKQIADIRSEGLPVLLFLPHVNRLVIETRAEDGDAETTILTKRTTALTISDTPEELRPECVDLGTLGSYLVAHKRVEPSRLRTSLQESVHEGFIDERWLEWSETAWVSAACRIDADADEHHCYTFLPMRAPSPLAGHLNAPFYTQFARLDLNEDVPLNALLLDVAADLCADTIFLMRNSGLDFAPRVIVDLLTWDSDHTSRIEAAFDSIGASVTDSLIVPIVRSKDGERWGSLTEACRWNDEGLKILTTKRLVKSTDANLVPTELGEARLNRLDAFRRNWFQDVGIEPDPDTKAEWAEAVARHLPSKKESISSWDNFYDDLEHVFEAEGSALIGRKILLDDVFRLQSSGWEPEEKGARRRRAVFFPPAREEAEDEEEIDTGVDVRIPKSLRKHLCFMNEGLSWLIQEGQIRRRKRSRQFLQRERLVRPYRSRDLLDHVTHVLELTKSSRTYRDALRWAFNLFSATRKRQELNFRRIPFKVPCIDGWLPATEALFSGAWEGESGRDLERLIQEAGSVSHEIETLATNLLLPPTEWPFSIADLPAWAEFLRQIGVRAGFWPIACGRENIERQGNMFSPQNLAQGLGLDDTDGARWVRAVNAQNNLPSPSYAHTPYRLQGYFWKLPGQADHERFSPVAKSIYARLIIHGLSHWEESHFQAHIQRPGHPRKPDLLSWPTPLTAFLMGACWAPMTRVGDWHSVDFVPLCEAWHFPDATEDPPDFLLCCHTIFGSISGTGKKP